MTRDQLKQMQGLPLDIKILKSKQRIREFYEHNNGNVYISFSGGKDSTVLLDLVRSIYPQTKAVFADTGLEYPELRDFVKGFENVDFIKPEKNFKQIIQEEGYPLVSKKVSRMVRDIKNPTGNNEATRKLYMTGERQDGTFCKSYKLAEKWMPLVEAPFEVSEKCCNYMKKNPFKKYEKENGSPKPFIGAMANESSFREREYLKSGCNSFQGHVQSNPMGFWTEQDVLKYIIMNALEIAPVYGEIVLGEDGKYRTTGEKRTGCIFCMFAVQYDGTPNRFQRLAKTHPNIYEYCFKTIDQGGLDLGTPLEYIGINYKPEEEDEQISMEQLLKKE